MRSKLFIVIFMFICLNIFSTGVNGVEFGMTKEQVKEVESQAENSSGIFYEDTTNLIYSGFFCREPIYVVYAFENDKLNVITFSLKELKDPDVILVAFKKFMVELSDYYGVGTQTKQKNSTDIIVTFTNDDVNENVSLCVIYNEEREECNTFVITTQK